MILCLCLAAVAAAHQQPPPTLGDESEKPAPLTPKQIEGLLKADHEHNLRDLERMARLVEQVQMDARKNAQYVISLKSVRDLEQIEKLSKAIRDRMKRY